MSWCELCSLSCSAAHKVSKLIPELNESSLTFSSSVSHGSVFPLFFQLGELEPLFKTFTADEEKELKRIMQRLDVLAKVALVQQLTAENKSSRQAALLPLFST